MSKVKATFGLFVAVGLPLAFAVICAGLAYGYGHEHVHNTWAELQGGAAVVKHADYYHSTGGVIATCGLLTLAWVVISALLALAGGSLFANRNKRWDG